MFNNQLQALASQAAIAVDQGPVSSIAAGMPYMYTRYIPTVLPKHIPSFLKIGPSFSATD